MMTSVAPDEATDAGGQIFQPRKGFSQRPRSSSVMATMVAGDSESTPASSIVWRPAPCRAMRLPWSEVSFSRRRRGPCEGTLPEQPGAFGEKLKAQGQEARQGRAALVAASSIRRQTPSTCASSPNRSRAAAHAERPIWFRSRCRIRWTASASARAVTISSSAGLAFTISPLMPGSMPVAAPELMLVTSGTQPWAMASMRLMQSPSKREPRTNASLRLSHDSTSERVASGFRITRGRVAMRSSSSLAAGPSPTRMISWSMPRRESSSERCG